MGGSLPGSLLRDELWICGDTVEDFFGMGTNYARSFHYPDNRQPMESPEDQQIRKRVGEYGTQ